MKQKHTEGRDEAVENFPLFDSYPELNQIEVTDKNLESVGKKFSGSAGLLEIDSISMSHWLLKFGGASAKLRKSIAKLVELLANGYPPWAVYRAITWCKLIGLEKCPGVRPVGMGDILWILFCKVLLIVAGKEAIQACGTDQLCSGVESGIEGGIHHIRSFWGILLIDVKKCVQRG